MATVQRFVNTASAGGDGTTNATSGANAAYASLASWIANTSGGSASDDYIVDCCGVAADTTPAEVDFAPSITSGSILIRANRGDAAGFYDGPLVISSSHYRLATGTSTLCLVLIEPNTTVDGLQLVPGHLTSNRSGINSTTSGSSGQYWTIRNCRLLNDGSVDFGLGFGSGVNLGGNGTTRTYENNLIVGFDVSGIYSWVSTHATNTTHILHNTIWGDGSSYGIRCVTGSGSGSPVWNISGNVVANAGTQDAISISAPVGTVNLGENATDQYPLGLSGEVDLGSAAAAWTDPGNGAGYDFTLKDTSSALYAAATPVLTHDLVGYERDGAYHDIGAYELQSGGSDAQAIDPSGISSVAALGSATVANVTAQAITPAGVASIAAFGSATVANVAAVEIQPDGLASSAAFGAAAIAVGSSKTVAAVGVGSAAAFGASAIANATPQAVAAAGVASVAAVGSTTIANVTARTISATGLASVAAIGTQTVTNVTAQTIAPTGIATGVRFGSMTLDGGSTPSVVRAWLRRIGISIGIGL